MMVRMVPPVLPHRFAEFRKTENFQISLEIPYFGQGCKISYEKACQKNEKLYTYSTYSVTRFFDTQVLCKKKNFRSPYNLCMGQISGVKCSR